MLLNKIIVSAIIVAFLWFIFDGRMDEGQD